MYREVKDAEAGCDLQISDVLCIHTRHSVYEFFVIDPVRVYGMVKGGVVGKSAQAAFSCASLATGAKAQLLIELPAGLRFITTSPIVSLRHFRSE